MAASEAFPWRLPGLGRSWLATWEQRRTVCSSSASGEQREAQPGAPESRDGAEPGTHQSMGVAQPTTAEGRGVADGGPGTHQRTAVVQLQTSWRMGEAELRCLQSKEEAEAKVGTRHNMGEAKPGTPVTVAEAEPDISQTQREAQPDIFPTQRGAESVTLQRMGMAQRGLLEAREDAELSARQNRTSSGAPLEDHGSPYLDESDPQQQPPQGQRQGQEQGQQTSDSQRRRSTAPWQHSLAGGLAGMGTTALLYPFDIVRTRMQVNDIPAKSLTAWSPRSAPLSDVLPKYRGTADAIATIARTEGLRGLYAGLYPSILGSTLSWGLYFLFYNNAKQRYRSLSQTPHSGDTAPPGSTFRADVSPPRQLSPLAHLAAATEAGVLSTLVTNPIWVVKTRLQLQVHSPSHAPSTASAPSVPPHNQTPGQSMQAQAQRPYYRGFHDALRMILKEEGFMGLYKGLGPGLLLVSHGSIQFLAYEELKQWMEQVEGRNALSGGHFLALGAASKLCAVLLTYPYQVLRSRMQIRPAPGAVHTKYRTSWQAAALMYRNEGLASFYKGLSPNLLRVLPSSSLTFFIYETLIGFFR